jgi:hypothetical protein
MTSSSSQPSPRILKRSQIKPATRRRTCLIVSGVSVKLRKGSIASSDVQSIGRQRKFGRKRSR